MAIFDRDGRSRDDDTDPGPSCPRLESNDQAVPLQPNQTCLVKATKTVTGGGTNIPDIIAFCRVRYSPNAVSGVRATITARHKSFPDDSQSVPLLTRRGEVRRDVDSDTVFVPR